MQIDDKIIASIISKLDDMEKEIISMKTILQIKQKSLTVEWDLPEVRAGEYYGC